MHEAVLVLDCGATNVKACLVASNGSILSTASRPNHTVPDPDYPNGLVWDADDIWNKMSACTRQAVGGCRPLHIRAVPLQHLGLTVQP
jgi:L-fuculokinase